MKRNQIPPVHKTSFDASRIFFPKHCVACNQVIPASENFCPACLEDVWKVKPPVCLLCGDEQDHCSCRGKSYFYDGCAAPFYYTGAVARGLVQLKKRRDKDRFLFFAKAVADTVNREYKSQRLDCVCMVPMYKSRLREREYNQSEVLAQQTADFLELPFLPAALQMTAPAAGQHTLDRKFRMGNVLGVYEADGSLCRGKSILLVDDIRTTGATLNECAKMLKLAGCECVFCAVAAITSPFLAE